MLQVEHYERGCSKDIAGSGFVEAFTGADSSLCLWQIEDLVKQTILLLKYYLQ